MTASVAGQARLISQLPCPFGPSHSRTLSFESRTVGQLQFLIRLAPLGSSSGSSIALLPGCAALIAATAAERWRRRRQLQPVQLERDNSRLVQERATDSGVGQRRLALHLMEREQRRRLQASLLIDQCNQHHDLGWPSPAEICITLSRSI